MNFDIKAIIISNTTDKNRENLKILINQKGGLSGKPIEKKSNKLIYNFI